MRNAVAILCLALLAPAAVFGAPAEKTQAQTVTGTIVKLAASERTVEVTLPDGSQQRFFWSAETKISGVLTPGAKVTLRYTAGTDGKNLALQITVARS
jgi:hypothetical protein